MNTIIHFETIGCKLNQIETESSARFFADAGFTPRLTPLTAKAALLPPLFSVVNTCTVTAKAEQKARRLIRLILAKFPDAPVVVTGCYAEVERESLSSINPRIVLLPGSQKDALADLPRYVLSLSKGALESPSALLAHLSAWNPVYCNKNEATPDNTIHADCSTKEAFVKARFSVPNEPSEPAFRLSTDTFYLHSRGSIKIQDGCSNACAYCRIRIARGKSVSLSVNDVLSRVQQIEASGQREIVLTGVNLTLYRGAYTTKDGVEYCNFAKLLSLLLQNTARVSFRISSLYPEHVNDELCAVIKNARVRPHFHLSVQSGSDTVLCAMKRNYNASDVVRAVSRLRDIKRDAFFACDIIAGFPGETDEDFAQTMDLCRACNFTWVHAFPFSPRPGTAAYTMKNRVPERIAGERVKALGAFAKQSKYDYARSFIGKTVHAIIEKRRRTVVRAVTENFLHIIIEGNYQELTALAGKEVLVRITNALTCNGNDDECEAVAEFVFCIDESMNNDLMKR